MFDIIKKIFEKETDFEFQKVRDFLSEIPSINAGGCAISSLAMYMWLEKHGKLKKSTRILYLSRYKTEFTTNQSFLVGKTNVADSCSHAILYHNGKFFDCEDEIDIISYKYKLRIPQEKTKEFVLNSLKYSTWNYLFQRSKYVPIIEKKLNLNLGLNN